MRQFTRFITFRMALRISEHASLASVPLCYRAASVSYVLEFFKLRNMNVNEFVQNAALLYYDSTTSNTL